MVAHGRIIMIRIRNDKFDAVSTIGQLIVCGMKKGAFIGLRGLPKACATSHLVSSEQYIPTFRIPSIIARNYNIL